LSPLPDGDGGLGVDDPVPVRRVVDAAQVGSRLARRGLQDGHGVLVRAPLSGENRGHARDMPTTRPRLTITETDDVAAALDAAAKRWPDVKSRRELLLRLVEQGHEVIENRRADAVVRRREAIRRTSGALTGAYEADYLDGLRDDWPA
jgi:hypothetical protein